MFWIDFIFCSSLLESRVNQVANIICNVFQEIKNIFTLLDEKSYSINQLTPLWFQYYHYLILHSTLLKLYDVHSLVFQDYIKMTLFFHAGSNENDRKVNRMSTKIENAEVWTCFCEYCQLTYALDKNNQTNPKKLQKKKKIMASFMHSVLFTISILNKRYIIHYWV